MTCPGLGARAELSRTSGCRFGRRWRGRDPDHSPCWRRPPATGLVSEVQVLSAAVVLLFLQDLLVLVLSVELSTHFVLLLGVGQRIVILREVGRLKPNGFGRNADLLRTQRLIHIY